MKSIGLTIRTPTRRKKWNRRPVQMNIYQINTYKKLKLTTFWWWPTASRETAVKEQQPNISVFIAPTQTSAVFHAWPYSRFIEIQSNLRRKKLHKTKQGTNFLASSGKWTAPWTWTPLKIPKNFKNDKKLKNEQKPFKTEAGQGAPEFCHFLLLKEDRPNLLKIII